jgi:hypothetical protein
VCIRVWEKQTSHLPAKDGIFKLATDLKIAREKKHSPRKKKNTKENQNTT